MDLPGMSAATYRPRKSPIGYQRSAIACSSLHQETDLKLLLLLICFDFKYLIFISRLSSIDLFSQVTCHVGIAPCIQHIHQFHFTIEDSHGTRPIDNVSYKKNKKTKTDKVKHFKIVLIVNYKLCV